MRDDPQFNDALEEIIKERLAREREQGKTQGKDPDDPVRRDHRLLESPVMFGRPVKSPSDTTLYTPAFKQAKQSDAIEQISNFVEEIRISGNVSRDAVQHRHSNNTPVRNSPGPRQRDRTPESRISERGRDARDAREQWSCGIPQRGIESRDDHAVKMRCANDITDRIIMQAEQFKANLAAPAGKLPYQLIKEKFVTNSGLGVIDSDIQMLRKFR